MRLRWTHKIKCVSPTGQVDKEGMLSRHGESRASFDRKGELKTPRQENSRAKTKGSGQRPPSRRPEPPQPAETARGKGKQQQGLGATAGWPSPARPAAAEPAAAEGGGRGAAARPAGGRQRHRQAAAVSGKRKTSATRCTQWPSGLT